MTPTMYLRIVERLNANGTTERVLQQFYAHEGGADEVEYMSIWVVGTWADVPVTTETQY